MGAGECFQHSSKKFTVQGSDVLPDGAKPPERCGLSRVFPGEV